MDQYNLWYKIQQKSKLGYLWWIFLCLYNCQTSTVRVWKFFQENWETILPNYERTGWIGCYVNNLNPMSGFLRKIIYLQQLLFEPFFLISPIVPLYSSLQVWSHHTISYLSGPRLRSLVKPLYLQLVKFLSSLSTNQRLKSEKQRLKRTLPLYIIFDRSWDSKDRLNQHLDGDLRK